MSRYFPDRNDLTGWERGAKKASIDGVKDVGGFSPIPAYLKPYLYYNRKHTDISAKVEASQRSTAPGSSSSVPTGGMSGEVSRSKRPSHRQGSWKRV